MKTVTHRSRLSVVLMLVLCLINVLSINISSLAQAEDDEPPFLTSPTLPDLSAFLPAPVVIAPNQVTAPATFIVNDTGDAPDADTSDLVCASAGSVCTLRAAIQQANATSDPDTIAFDLAGDGPFIFTPATPLPIITQPVTIDGTSQPGYVDHPLISINASGLTYGLAITANNSSLTGLHFVEAALVNVLLVGSNNTIKGCFIGTNVTGDGDISLEEGRIGIGIQGAANMIGGTNIADRNIISDLSTGIFIEGANATGNIVQGNWIGLLVNGTETLWNADGIYIFGASHTLVGGKTSGAGNLISGNTSGVVLFKARSTKIQGNVIGLNAAGEADFTEYLNYSGIVLSHSLKTTIGGSSGAGNVISGNSIAIDVSIGNRQTRIFGNIIGLNAAGDAARKNISGISVMESQSTYIGGDQPGQGNVISSNLRPALITGGAAIHVVNANGVTIRGNKIGTDIIGTIPFGNTTGISVVASRNVIIGGLTSGARNVIAGHDEAGIFAYLVEHLIIQGNYVGTNLSGTAAIPNEVGIDLKICPYAFIGGSDPDAGNLISGNNQVGIRIDFSFGVTVQRNLIGTDADGTASLGNNYAGLEILSSSQALIARNTISGNTVSGLVLYSQSVGTRVESNYIGTSKNGLAPLGNGSDGIYLTANGVLIGGNSTKTRNVISANGGNGIRTGSGVTITGNYIGTNRKGKSTPNMANGQSGIWVDGGSVTIGGLGELGNRIIDHPSHAISVLNTEVTIVGNYLSNNGGLGIDIGHDGVTPNDPLDADRKQNYPVISFLKRSGNAAHPKTQIKGSLDSTPFGDYTLHFYSVKTCDPSGYGEADKYLGQKVVQADENGEATFSVKFPVKLNVGDSVVATATKGRGDTSEFSACFSDNPAPIADTSGGLRR